MGIVGYECIIHVERYQVVDVVEKVQWLGELFSEYAEYMDENRIPTTRLQFS